MTKQEVISFLISLWNEKEVELFNDYDLNGEEYPFKEQIEDRYKEYFVSYLSFEVIKKSQIKWVEKYRPLINKETKTSIRNLFIDQLENTVFVTKISLDLNNKTITNLKNNLKTKNKGTLWAIQEIIKRIDKDVCRSLSILVDNQEYSVEEQLKARWNNTWFFENKKLFQEQLDSNKKQALGSPKKVKDLITFQLFLLKMDDYFLVRPSSIIWLFYCWVYRIIKKSRFLAKSEILPSHIFYFFLILMSWFIIASIAPG